MNEKHKHVILVILGLCLIMVGGYILNPGNGLVEHYKEKLNCTELQDGQFECTTEWVSAGGSVAVGIPVGIMIIGIFLFFMSSYCLLSPTPWRNS